MFVYYAKEKAHHAIIENATVLAYLLKKMRIPCLNLADKLWTLSINQVFTTRRKVYQV